MLSEAISVLKSSRTFFLNPFQSGSVHGLIITHLEKLLPQYAHKMCNGQLGLSLTKMSTFENNFVKEFESRQDLIDAVSAGCFIPFWSGSLSCPLYKGEEHADGAYSNNMPKFDLTPEQRLSVIEGNFNCIKQVDLCPFPSEVAVSPQGERGFSMLILGTKYKLNWYTIVRTFQAMFPFPTTSYEPFLFAGHRDMKDFLFRNNLIKCQKCYSNLINKNTIKSNWDDNNRFSSSSSGCLLCLKILEKVDSLQVSEELARLNRG